MTSNDNPVFWEEVHSQAQLALQVCASLNAICRITHTRVKEDPAKMSRLAELARDLLSESTLVNQVYGSQRNELPAATERVAAQDMPKFYNIWGQLSELVQRLQKLSTVLESEF